jgi:hypothetical protein
MKVSVLVGEMVHAGYPALMLRRPRSGPRSMVQEQGRGRLPPFEARNARTTG